MHVLTCIRLERCSGGGWDGSTTRQPWNVSDPESRKRSHCNPPTGGRPAGQPRTFSVLWFLIHFAAVPVSSGTGVEKVADAMTTAVPSVPRAKAADRLGGCRGKLWLRGS
jgi:hypothetical protein